MATRGLPTWPFVGSGTDDLPRAEAVMLDAARAWGAAVRIGIAPLAAARLPLVTEDAGDVAPALDAILRAVMVPDALGCSICTRVTTSEGAILMALGLAQRGPRREALAAFLRIAPPPAAYAATAPAIMAGTILRRAGLLLVHPLRPAP